MFSTLKTRKDVKSKDRLKWIETNHCSYVPSNSLSEWREKYVGKTSLQKYKHALVNE